MRGTLLRMEDFFYGSERVALSNLISRFGNDSFLILIFILISPNLIPFLCQFGIAETTSGLVCLLSLQMIFGREVPWLPKKIAEKQLSTQKIISLSDKILPWLYRLDLLTQPRIKILSDEASYRFYGVMFFILAFLILLPLPFFNYAPAVVIMLSVIGLLSRDGLFLLAGMGLFATILTGLFYFIYWLT